MPKLYTMSAMSRSLLPRRPTGGGLVADVGGTTLRIGVFDPRSGLLKSGVRRRTSPSFLARPAYRNAALQALLVNELAEDVLSRRGPGFPRWLSVSVCGPVDSGGRILRAPPLWGGLDRPLPLRAQLERRLKIPVFVANDLSAAAAFYGQLPRYRRFRRVCVVAVSTGVGNKIIDTRTRELHIDPKGLSGELGHVRMDFSSDAPRCDCGGRGHVSALSSGRGAEYLARKLARERPALFRDSPLFTMTRGAPGRIGAEFLARAARSRDRFAIQALKLSIEPLARSAVLLAGAAGVEKFILIGGFATGVGPLYRRLLVNRMRSIGMFGRTQTDPALLVDLPPGDQDACLAGAGVLALSNFLLSA